ncbi:MAG: PAS domain S-box protein [Gammaproteobacteria bacterium]|nr:PAS domain S-box protein [Gammaproteobacteria bacterium]
MPITPPPAPLTRLSFIRGFLGLFLPLCGVLTIVGSMHYYSFYTTESATRQAREKLNVDLARRTLTSDITGVVGDLMFLSENIERQRLFEQSEAERDLHISRKFVAFSKNKRLYDQIRYLDNLGREVVRINYNDGKPASVPGSELQNKSERYYFPRAITLEKGRFYLSPLDLNVEEGEIERPLKPMMRFSTPVFDSDGRKQGIVVLNYLGSRLIDNFIQAAANIADHVALLNNQGFWLSSPDDADEWGFMLDKDTLFSQRYPQAWERIQREMVGQFRTVNGLFTFTTIHPLEIAMSVVDSDSVPMDSAQGRNRFWKIVSQVGSRELSATFPFFIQNHLALYLSMLGLLALGSWFLTTSHQRHRKAVSQRDYEQRFRHTLENINLAAVALDRSGRITFCNDFFLRLTGWEHDEVVGARWLDRFVSTDLQTELDQVQNWMKSPESLPSRFESRIRNRNGDLRLVAWNNTLSYDTDGATIGVTAIGEDITEQRRTEEELRKLFRAVEQSPSIVLITDNKGLIEYANPKFTEVSGYTIEEVIGRNPRLLKSGETSSLEYSNLWKTVVSGGEWRGEFHNRKKSGELYWESASISAIRNPQREITNFIAVKEDITERKRLEQEVEEQNRELARTQALTTMGRMASMIAHDLRNPLSSVKMTVQILGKQAGTETNEEIEELHQISMDQIRYMEEILSDMLTYSRPDALKPDWISIDKVIDMAVGISQRRIEEYEVEMVTRYHPGLPTLFVDATKLRQVFSNLLTNAIQATENNPKPKIVIDAMIELGQNGTSIRIEVCDNGRGIDKGDAERIFEPYFTTRAKGTGLGLAIVNRILEQHQAEIDVLPNQPQGTCVSVTIPVTPPASNTGYEEEKP